MHYLIYQITNKINGKIYVGKHQTDNIKDDYMGSGHLIKRAIAKHGLENFEKTILHECSSLEEMNAKEAEIVNEEFLARKDVYNLKVGGEGGFDFINANLTKEYRRSLGLKGAATLRERMKDPTFREAFSKHAREVSNRPQNIAKYRAFMLEGHRTGVMSWLGKKHKESSKAKIGAANAIHQKGEGNSHYGCVWIKNDKLHYNKSIPSVQLDEYLAKGWIKGRCMTYTKEPTL